MKKLTAWVLGAVLLPLSALAAQYEEGKHYEVIADQVTAKPEVKEFFSFYCPHCNSFEPTVQAMEKKLSADTEFKKIHVDFLRQASPEIQNTLARAYLVAKNIGKGDEVAHALFQHIHVAHKAFASDADIRAVVVAAGIDGATYDKAIKSFAVVGAAKQMKKEQDTLSSKRILTGVPMFVVNGKYKILNQGLDPSKMDQDFNDLVQFLLNKK